MKSFHLILAVIAPFALTWNIKADEWLPGSHDKEALHLLRQMTQALPLRTTTLKQVATSFAVDKQPGLTWDQAVAAANMRYGSRQPERAAFLRKYLERGSPESNLSELQLPEYGVGMTTGSGRSKGFVIGLPEEPSAIIWFSIANDKLVGAPTLTLTSATVDGVVYGNLNFDLADCLTSAHLQVPLNSRRLTVGQNTSGKGGVNFYHATFSAGDRSAMDDSESIHFSPEMAITERWVQMPNQLRYREVYEKGRLRKRLHYAERQVAGGTETYVKKEDDFP